MKRMSPITAVLALLPALACGAAGEPDAGMAVDTLANGALSVRYARDVADLDRALRATELLRIGEAAGESARAFGRIRDLALGSDGRVYVLDAQARELRIFDAAGAHVRTVGREGGGPGEFRSPRGMRWHPSGTLWIADFGSQRYTELTPEGEVLATRPRLVPMAGVDWEGGFDRDGFLYDAGWHTTAAGERAPIYVRFRVADGAVVPLDTFPLPSATQPSYVVAFRGGLLNLPVPFAPRPGWAFDGEALWLATADRYELVRRSLAGDTLVRLEVPHPLRPVTAAERAAARHDIETTLAGAGASADGVDFSLIPATHPAHGRVRVDDAGRLWVARRPAASNDDENGRASAHFDIFEADGRYVGHVALGLDAGRPVAFRNGLIAGVHRDELDVEYVIVHRVDG